MKKYMIDYTAGSGSGCDKIFDTKEDAQMHMKFLTPEERKDLEIVEIEVQYALCFNTGDKYEYATDVEQYLKGETCCNTCEATAWIDTQEEAEKEAERARDYFDEHEMNVSVIVEELTM